MYAQPSIQFAVKCVPSFGPQYAPLTPTVLLPAWKGPTSAEVAEAIAMVSFPQASFRLHACVLFALLGHCYLIGSCCIGCIQKPTELSVSHYTEAQTCFIKADWAMAEPCCDRFIVSITNTTVAQVRLDRCIARKTWLLVLLRQLTLCCSTHLLFIEITAVAFQLNMSLLIAARLLRSSVAPWC